MMLFIVMSIALTATAAGCAMLIRKKIVGYRGELYILVSCLYFVSLFALAQYTFSEPAEANAAGYAAEIRYKGGSIAIQPPEQVLIPVSVKNVGTNTWDSFAQTGPVFMSYHVLTLDGTIVSYDNPRIAFQGVVRPGTTTSLEIPLHTLPTGRYIVRLDLVAEYITWFQEQGTQTVDIVVNIFEEKKHD